MKIDDMSFDDILNYLRLNSLNSFMQIVHGINDIVNTLNEPNSKSTTKVPKQTSTAPETASKAFKHITLTPRQRAGKKAAETRREAKIMHPYNGKYYLHISKKEFGALHISRTAIQKLGGFSKNDILIVGKKGLTPFSVSIRADGSVYIPSVRLKAFPGKKVMIRKEGNKLILKGSLN